MKFTNYDGGKFALMMLENWERPNFCANDWVQLRELLNKVCDLANLIEERFSRGYAKTVVLSSFQRGYLVSEVPTKLR